MKYFLETLIALSLFVSACHTENSSQIDSGKRDVYSPIPIENSVILEADSSLTASELIVLLQKYSDAHINTLCVKAKFYDSKQLNALVDSCHQAGINFILHCNNPRDVNTKWVNDFDVDGFHCTNVLSQSVDYWRKEIDSLNELKPVIMISDNSNDELIDAGFSAGRETNISKALAQVFESNESTSLLDTALNSEKYIFSKTFAAIRLASENSLSDTSMESSQMLTMYAMPGVPCVTSFQLQRHNAFLKSFFSLYANTPTLQYGSYELYNSGSTDVFTLMRTYQGKKILFAINTRNKPSSYNWPLNLMGIKTELLLGEKISRNGGQELSPYGYQVLNFENIVGMEALELDDK